MKTEKEAIEFIETQFDDIETSKFNACRETTRFPYHYGKLDLASLLSYIYEVPVEHVRIKK